MRSTLAVFVVCGLIVTLARAQRFDEEGFARAQALLEAKHYAEARERFDALLSASPGSAAARQGYAEAAIGEALEASGQQRPQRALVILDEASRRVPDNAEVQLDLGVEAVMLHQFTLAETSLTAADRLRPDHPRTLYALARLATEEGRLPQAAGALKAYLRVMPDDASAWYGLGHVYAMQQQDAEAQAAFQQSIKLKPLQTESYYQLGELALNRHDDAEAAQMFGKTLERMPQHAGALTGLGEVQLRAKQYALAEQTLLSAERADPAYQTPHYFRGLALDHLGRRHEAAEELAHGDARQHAAAPATNTAPESSADPPH